MDEYHLAKLETDFLYLLFTNIPYYAITIKINEFLINIKKIPINHIYYKKIINLFLPIINEMQFTINERIKTETNAHILLLLSHYSFHKNIEEKKTYSFIIS